MDRIHEKEPLEKAMEFLKNNVNTLLYIIIGIAVVAGIFTYRVQTEREREITARMLLEEGKQHLREDEVEESRAQFETLLSDYPLSSSAGEAVLYMARAEISAGEYDKAIDFLKRYIDEYPDGEFLPEAYAELGYAHESLGNFPAAAEYYSYVHTRFPSHHLAPVSVIDEAGCRRELGEYEKAGELYQKVISAYPWSGAAETARMYLEML